MSRFEVSRWDAVVFDVDGTLYEQGPLRRRMVIELLLHVAGHPRQIGMLRRLQSFRRQRELISENELEGAGRLQYQLPAAELGVPIELIRNDVEEWMERRPLPHLQACRVPGVRRFFGFLRSRGVRIGVLSDYPANGKLAALDLEANVVVSGVDPAVDRLKPHPAGLLAVLAALGVAAEKCLLIGDRDDRDGECARRAGVGCLLRQAGSFRHFTELMG